MPASNGGIRKVGIGKTGTGPGGKVADYTLNRLKEWGVNRIFGYLGDGINGFLGAFHRASGQPEFIQVRHEEMAAFMAAAHAKFTGEIGVCIATSAPGAIHLLNGLYDAKLDHQPVLALVGQQKQVSVGADYQPGGWYDHFSARHPGNGGDGSSAAHAWRRLQFDRIRKAGNHSSSTAVGLRSRVAQ